MFDSVMAIGEAQHNKIIKTNSLLKPLLTKKKL
jgi:hypothetical protein